MSTALAPGARWGVALAAVAAAALRLPFLTAPPGQDEGGFLLVGGQWHSGTSLYGDYWVDRPPLLIALFAVADRAGGVVGLRLIGVVAVVASVLVAAAVAGAADARRVVAVAVAIAALLTSPLLGSTQVDGELLGVPLVLVGILALVRGHRAARSPHRAPRRSPRRGPQGAGAAFALAGVAGASAFLVKQDMVDVLVVAAMLAAPGLRQRESRRAALTALAITGGAFVATIAAWVGFAASRGTAPGPLWDAVVTFRGQAAAVIRQWPGSSTTRAAGLVESFAVSGGLALLAVLLPGLGSRAQPTERTDRGTVVLRGPALALLTWEILAVVAGGSYWRHYLIGLVPGLVLLAAAAGQRPVESRRRTGATHLAVAWCAAATLVSTVAAPHVPVTRSPDERVAAYLRAHARPSATVVVGFGHPDIVYDAGLRSPYPLLWSLPVRARDPSLRRLGTLLAGSGAPTWVVVEGSSLGTWGVDSAAAQRTLQARYRSVDSVGGWTVWRRASTAVPSAARA